MLKSGQLYVMFQLSGRHQYCSGSRHAIKQGKEEGKKEGKKEGKEEGKREGKEEGKRENQLEVAKNLLNMGMEIRVISEIVGISEEEIMNIK